MNVTFEKEGNVAGKIIVTVDVADYESKVKKELRRFSETHVIPGFRPGHVPMDQLRRRFGKDVKSEVINDMVFDAVKDYIIKNNLPILGQPLPAEVKEINLTDEDYTFSYEVGLAPEMNVEVDKNVTLPYYTIEVTDEMLENQDKALRHRLGSQVPGDEVEEDSLVKGTIFELNEDGTVKEGEDAIQVIAGIVAPKYMKDKDEAAKFTGKKVGDKITFNPYKSCEGNASELASMLNIEKDKAANVKSDFEFTVTEIIVLRPAEHDQEFFDNVFGADKVHNEEEYKAALTEMIARDLEPNSNQLFGAMTRQYFIDKYKDAELPETFLKKWLVRTDENLKEETIDEEFAKMRDSLIWQLAEDEISKKLDVKVTEDFLLQQAKQIAYQQFAQYGITNLDDDTITEHAKHLLANKDFYSRIYDNASSNMIFAAIRAAVTIDDQKVTIEQFRELASKL